MIRSFVTVGFGLTVFLFVSCGFSSGDALASYVDRNGKKHEITRGEVYRTMGQGKESMLSDSGRQRTHIDNVLLQHLQAQEALFAGLDKEERYSSETNSYATNQLMLGQFFDQYFNREKLKYKLPAYKVRIILLQRERNKRVTEPDPNRENAMRTRNVPRTVDEMADHEVELLVAAKEILGLLKAPEADFAAIAQARSSHASKTNGGFLGVLLPRQNDIPYLVNKAIADLKVGEYTTEAVNTENGYYIVKLEEVFTVKQDTLQKYIPDAGPEKPRESFYKEAAWFASVWAFIDETIKKESGKDITINYDGLSSDDTNTILLSITSPGFNKTMTLGEILHSLDYTSPPRRSRMGLIHNNLPVKDYSPAELSIFFEQVLSTPVLNYAAYKSGVAKSQAFKLALSDMSQNLLARMAQDKFRETLRQVTDEDVASHYKNNLSRYVNKTQVGTNPDGSPRFTEQQMPLDEDLEEQIREELYNQWSNESYENWKTELITRYQAKVYEQNFEVVKKPEPPPHKHGPDCKH